MKRLENQVHYESMPYHKRFWFNAEICYTDEELGLRELLLKIRKNSGLNPKYLNNLNPWFGEFGDAFVNINERAWFYHDAYKPKQVISRDDFYVQPLNGQDIQWPILYHLMQNIGDYLLIRNQNLPQEHLNQPLNFIYLDWIQILSHLTRSTDPQHVLEELEIFSHYLRTIEKHVSPVIGSDRVFIVDIRQMIHLDIQPQLSHVIQSQNLRTRFEKLSKSISQLSEERNRILHFSLSKKKVNPHAYQFSNTPLSDLSFFPTQIAKNCRENQQKLLEDQSSRVQFTVNQLRHCIDLDLILTDDVTLNHYAKAISDLSELDHFQKIIVQLMDLLAQGGEVFTIHQFRQQMVVLLEQIEHFIEDSSEPIHMILTANMNAYHQAIQDKKNAPFWRQWVSQYDKALNLFIQNQDNFAHFLSTPTELAKTKERLKMSIQEMMGQLAQTRLKETPLEAIGEKASSVNQLIQSMHDWISFQYSKKGVSLPELPKTRELLSVSQELISDVSSSATDLKPFLWLPKSQETIRYPLLGINNARSIMFSLPVAAIALLLLTAYANKPDSSIKCSEKYHRKLNLEIDDKLTKIKRLSLNSNHQDISDEYDYFVEIYENLRGKRDLAALTELNQNLEWFYVDHCGEIETVSLVTKKQKSLGVAS
jgi:hypothetical protein